MTYDGQRAMFEAYARNKYTSTGVIQWMLNNAMAVPDLASLRLLSRPSGRLFRDEKGLRAGPRAVFVRRRLRRRHQWTYELLKGTRVTAKIYSIDAKERASPRRNTRFAGGQQH